MNNRRLIAFKCSAFKNIIFFPDARYTLLFSQLLLLSPESEVRNRLN